ncbi:Interferon-induced 6-16 family [Plasmodiophora brassicae]
MEGVCGMIVSQIMSWIQPSEDDSYVLDAAFKFLVDLSKHCPMVSHLKSVIQQAACGDLDATFKILVDLSKHFPLFSQLQSPILAVQGDMDGARDTQLVFSTGGHGLALVFVIACAVAGPTIAAACIAAAGFGQGGIVAGSAAAGFMGSYGGAVSAGSLCAVLQSAGAAGLSPGLSSASAAASAAVAASASFVVAVAAKHCSNVLALFRK